MQLNLYRFLLVVTLITSGIQWIRSEQLKTQVAHYKKLYTESDSQVVDLIKIVYKLKGSN